MARTAEKPRPVADIVNDIGIYSGKLQRNLTMQNRDATNKDGDLDDLAENYFAKLAKNVRRLRMHVPTLAAQATGDED